MTTMVRRRGVSPRSIATTLCAAVRDQRARRIAANVRGDCQRHLLQLIKGAGYGDYMKRIDLLKQMSFGVQVAEDEVHEIASYFVETNQWDKVAKGDIDIIRGEKGAGKSAIDSLLMAKTDLAFFDQGILLVAAENPRGATVFKDLVADPPTTENEFTALWKLYALAIIAQQLREYDIRGPKAEKIYAALEGANLTSVLLERIRAERATAPIRAKAAKGAPRTGRHGKPRR